VSPSRPETLSDLCTPTGTGRSVGCVRLLVRPTSRMSATRKRQAWRVGGPLRLGILLLAFCAESCAQSTGPARLTEARPTCLTSSGLEVCELHRIRVGGLSLRAAGRGGALPVGMWRFFDEAELLGGHGPACGEQ
jgi:hypothetical protein